MNETFEEWLKSSQAQRDALFSFSKSAMPDGQGRSDDIEKAIRGAEAAGLQLASVQYFLTSETAKASIAARASSPELSVKERETAIKDSVKDIQRLYDCLDVLARSLNSRIRSQLNARRSIL